MPGCGPPAATVLLLLLVVAVVMLLCGLSPLLLCLLLRWQVWLQERRHR
jgi:hypothetical protein